MSLLSDDDKALLVLEHLGPAALAGDTMSLYDCFQLALDVAEKAVLAKLASAELPEPLKTYPKSKNVKNPFSVYSADQLRQAYAQGAAAQLSSEPSGFIDRYGEIFAEAEQMLSTDTPLYTRREA